MLSSSARWFVLALAVVGTGACRQPQPAPLVGQPPAPLPPPPPAEAPPAEPSAPPPSVAPSVAPTATATAPKPAPKPKPDAAPKPAAAPPSVEVSEPSFVGGGTVPDVEKFLDKMKKVSAKCVADHGPPTQGRMRIQFLVTLRGRAEGVDVLSAKGMSDGAKQCVRDAFKNQRVGTPTADPTGVQFTYTFE